MCITANWAADVSDGSKPEKLHASICFPLFTQQRTSPRSGEEPDVKEAQRLMSIAEYWANLADIEDGQRESTVGETTGGLNDSRSMRSRLASYLSRPLSEIR